MRAFVIQTTLALGACVVLLIAYRWIRIRAPLAALVFASGLLFRVIAGIGLALSWLASAPVAERLLPDDRWFPDAQMYFEVATLAADGSLSAVGDDQASPTFVRSLALWMRATGSSHGTAHLLNLLVYSGISVGVCYVLTRRRDALGATAAAVVIGAFAFSPNLIILASQPLKDTLFFGALALTVIALWWLLPDDHDAPLRLRPVPLAFVLLGVYLMSGMRAYFGLMLLGLLGVVLVFRGLPLLHDRARSLRYAGAAVLLLFVVWAGCRLGGGPYYEWLVDPVVTPVTTRLGAGIDAIRTAVGLGTERNRPTTPTDGAGLLSVVERARRGFEDTGGGTNMAPPELDRSMRSGLLDRAYGVMLGLGAVFVPVTLLRASGLVSFPGGGRMLLLTDIDTIFIDLATVGCLVLLWRHRREFDGRWTLPGFLLILGVVSAGLVGYVVTNYGTLFRLRLIAVVPFWLLPLALARPSRAGAPTSAAP